MSLRWLCSLEFDLKKVIQFGWFGTLTTLSLSLLIELGMTCINDQECS